MEKLDIKMNTKRSISLTKKRLRNRNNILRSKLRNDVDINNKDEENGFFLSRLNKTAKSYTKYHKIKKHPIPMKYRALPPSFWQQPNKMIMVSNFDQDDNNNCYLNSEIYKRNYKRTNEEIISDANTDLLFSLFKSVEDEQMLEENNNVNKRKRTRSTKVLRDDDPYLASNITENLLLPLLPVRNKVESLQQQQQQQQQQREQVFLRNSSTCRDSSSYVTNCGLNQRQNNYSQLLSQLVVQL